jgi:hypothetical protein
MSGKPGLTMLMVLAMLPGMLRAQICPVSNAVGVDGIGDGCTTQYKGVRAEYLLPHIGIFRSTFTPACDGHDKCYSTLGSTYDECDSQFRSRMLDACKSNFNPLFLPGEYSICVGTAHEYYAAVRAYAAAEDPLPGIQSEALNRSRNVQANVEGDICGTTPSRITLYSNGLIGQINNTFLAYTGRQPTPYEFFDVVNAGDIVRQRGAWEAILLSKAQSAAFASPPTVGFQAQSPGIYEGPQSRVTLTANPLTLGVKYLWRTNLGNAPAPSIGFAVNPRSNTLAISGYLKATSEATGAKNLLIVQETFHFQNVCGPDEVACY